MVMDYLLTKGVARENILLEDSSRHTLENLHHARSMYLGKKNKTTCLVTSRYHLARSHVFAQGLNIWHRLCAAEDEFTLNSRNVMHFAREAYFLHWYKVGKWWSNTMNSQHSMRRIS